MPARLSIFLPLIVCLLEGDRLRAAEPVGTTFFEEKIRPVLVEQCSACHSTEAANKKQLKGGLLVDSREGLRRGGESGPAVVPGDVEASLILGALRHETFKMPPSGKLSAQVIADFTQWIQAGAPDPRETPSAPHVEPQPNLDPERARREHWAFQPLDLSPPPQVQHTAWVRNDIDRYLLSAWEAAGLEPPESAEAYTLARRVHFDLVGLPPGLETLAEIDAAGSLAEDRYAALVDELLSSPHYGERWGRHWLDLARYADSSGFHSDLDRPNAWRYRDYVISSFNQDKPYAQFIAEQLAGDELDAVTDETRIATAFGSNGPSNDDNMGTGKAQERYRYDLLDDTISTTATVFLGLTLGCARCHDHKLDPLTARDYYSFLAIFDNTARVGGPVTRSLMKKGDPLPKIQELVEPGGKLRTTRLLRRGNLDFPGEVVEPAIPAVLAARPLNFPTPSAEQKTTGRRRALAEWLGSPDNALVYRVLANRLWQHHFGRGLVSTPSNFGLGGERPSHPALLDYLARQIIEHGGRLKPVQKLIVTSSSYRRKAIVDCRLTIDDSQRVAAAVSSNPQSSIDNRQSFRAVVPDRLTAEALRDAVLSASGKLNTQLGGPGIKPRIRAELITTSQRNKWPEVKQEGPNEWRRSVYIYVKRQLLMPMMELFDAPTTTDSCPQRSTSVVPTQALVLMNDEFIEEQSGHLAQRLIDATGEDLLAAVEMAFRLTHGKPPSESRRQQSLAFVLERRQSYESGGARAFEARRAALADLAHVLFNSSEFVYVE